MRPKQIRVVIHVSESGIRFCHHLNMQGPEPQALATGTVGTTPVLIVGSRNGLIYVFNMRGVSANFESVHREGSTNDIWNNLYANDAAGDQMISDIG